jgi:hypothetical protein
MHDLSGSPGIYRPSAGGGFRLAHAFEALEPGSRVQPAEDLARFGERCRGIVRSDSTCQPLPELEQGDGHPEREADLTEIADRRLEQSLSLVLGAVRRPSFHP